MVSLRAGYIRELRRKLAKRKKMRPPPEAASCVHLSEPVYIPAGLATVDFKGWRVNAAWAGLFGIPGHTCADLFRFPSVRLIRHISYSGVAKDEAAVRAAIALPWSNGRGPSHTAQNGKAPNVRSRQNRLEELRKKEINGSIRLPKRDFFTRGQKLKVKDPWHILSGYDLEFAGMSARERVRVMLEWFGRRQTIALQINSVVGCLIAAILLMILLENNVRTRVSRRDRESLC